MKVMSKVISVVIFLTCLSTHGFAQSNDLSPDSAYKLVQSEKEKVLSIFKPNRDFHLALRYETAGLNIFPYNRLDSLFKEMKSLADSSIVSASLIDSLYDSEIKIWNKEYRYWVKIMSENRKQVKELSNAYQSTLASSNITKTSNPRMIELMGKRVKQWQDSLTLQGRIIGETKVDLKKRFPEQTGELFLKAYAPISELEANHKRFQTLLLQLENMQSRFEEMNSEVVYFTGPGIQPTQEVVIVDQLLGQFVLEMKSFRDWKSKYWQQFQ